MSSITYYLSLGSNLGRRDQNLALALDFLKTLGRLGEVSSLYETEPLDMEPGTPGFYNQAAALESTLLPGQLLAKIKEFEKEMGRDLESSHYRPRTMDIDILLAGDMVVEEKELVVPHREMHRRAFVLVPLVEIAPSVLHPLLGKSARELLSSLKGQAAPVKLKKAFHS